LIPSAYLQEWTAKAPWPESEHDETYVAYKQRREYEKSTRDPDDCYLMVMEREKELLDQDQPSKIKILFNTGEATREEIMSPTFGEEAEDEMDQDRSPVKGTDGHGNSEYRRRLIARVEALRQQALMTRYDFHQQIGAVASASWIKFSTQGDEAAWHHFSMKAISRICKLFGVGAELL
jgi:hypothetical protein